MRPMTWLLSMKLMMSFVGVGICCFPCSFTHDMRHGYDAYAVPCDNRLIAALLWEHRYSMADFSNECFPTNLILQVNNTFKNEIHTTVFGSFCFCLSKAYSVYKFLNAAIA